VECFTVLDDKGVDDNDEEKVKPELLSLPSSLLVANEIIFKKTIYH
jgi:hypothetical protein